MLLLKRTENNKNKQRGETMIGNNRQLEILDLLSEKGNVSVEELASIFNVSRMTIRRDLEKLQESNLLQRTHGGALINKVLLHEMAYHEKREEHALAKQHIATEAVKYVKNASIIYLDAGTTTYEVALKLPREGLTVITNDIRIAAHLMLSNNTVIFLGGMILKDTGSTTDQHSQMMLSEFNIDLAILATSSIDNKLFLCTPDHDRQIMKQIALKQSEKSILVTDSSKFFSKSLYKIAPVTDFEAIITNLPIDKLLGADLGSTEYIYVNTEHLDGGKIIG